MPARKGGRLHWIKSRSQLPRGVRVVCEIHHRGGLVRIQTVSQRGWARTFTIDNREV